MSEFDERTEMVNDFVHESRDLLDEIEPQIIIMEEHASNSGGVNSEILNGIFRLFHSIKGMASFLDLQTVIDVTHEAETLLDIFRKKEVPLDAKHIELLYKTSDFMRTLLDNIEHQLNDNGFEDVANEIIGEIKQSINGIALDNTNNAELDISLQKIIITPEIAKKFVDESLETFEEAEAALLELEQDPNRKDIIEQVFRVFHSFKGNAGFFGYADLEKISHKAENILDEVRDGKEKASEELITNLLAVIDALRSSVQQLANGNEIKANELQASLSLLDVIKDAPSANKENSLEQSSNGKTDYTKQSNANQQAIRVDIEKLDKLIDLVGELVISEAMVSHNPDVQGLQLPKFEKAVLQLAKITREIQDVSMSMRMIPLAGTFKKMIRLVRDLSLKANKKVSLEIIGEETEVDKTIIEQISDPLVHLIRNAVDHGLECPEERQQTGKPETGNLTIEAKHSAGEVWIIIKDDGRGLNKEKIIKKAIERGIIEGNKELKDEEVWKLIFEPGLSTAEQISSISGRGVGMDVVKQNIEKLRGRIDVKSVIGQGTLFAIRIPLTLAIIEGMVVRVGQAHYTIPIISIKESLQPKMEQITITPDGLEIVNVRGELLPIIRVHELYKIAHAKEKLTEGILIVVESDTQKCCLLVDELVGQQQIVIKGLPEYLGNVRGVSGFAILGDGEVSMILDISNLTESIEGLLNGAYSSEEYLIAAGGE